ncbi:MAG TPA: lysophospholipid acyltransferase family protein [Planctomycetaceae bacterium]|nr:lysophospholipid acyltransferase family protein [Planctomycetaceae bacterium]
MKIRSRLLTRLLAAVAVLLIRGLFLTCRRRWRIEADGINPYTDTAGRRFLYCVWHDQIVTTVFFDRPRHVAALVSRHQDGSYLADAMALVGVTPIRGSSSRGGAQALRKLFDAARRLHVVITPDGPRGPRRQLKDGIVFLAAHSGRPIVPTATACRRGWRIRGSWTDLLLPRPFTTVFAIAGSPIDVPPDLTREQLADYTSRLQTAMDRLQESINHWAAGGPPPAAAAPPAPAGAERQRATPLDPPGSRAA